MTAAPRCQAPASKKPSRFGAKVAGAEASERELPWRLIVHFQAFPSGTLLRSSPKEAEQLLLNALKEACHLRCGSALPVMSLPPEAQAELTAALSSSGGSDARAHQDFASGRAYEAFAKVDEKLRRGMANQLGGGGGGGGGGGDDGGSGDGGGGGSGDDGGGGGGGVGGGGGGGGLGEGGGG